MSSSSGGSRRILMTASILLPLLVAACAGGGSPVPASGSPLPGTPAPGTPAPTDDPTDDPSGGPGNAAAVLLLDVSSEGGFINPTASLAALPTVVVYADGRILTPAGPAADLPDPLLSRVSVRDVGAVGAAAIRAAIQAAGLDRPGTADPGVAADSGTSVFDVSIGSSVVTTRFAANGPGGPGGPGVPGGGGDNPGRTAAFDLLSRLLDPAESWGAPSPAAAPYEPVAFRVFVAPGAAAADAASTVAWPLSTDLASFGSPAVPDRGVPGLRAGAVFGADAAKLGPVLAAATSATVFTSGGARYTLYVRPLLPHELPG